MLAALCIDEAILFSHPAFSRKRKERFAESQNNISVTFTIERYVDKMPFTCDTDLAILFWADGVMNQGKRRDGT